MKSSLNFSNPAEAPVEIFVTPSEVLEYIFCPRFIYYMNCLCVDQHEERRYKVLKGREVHKEREKINRSYLRRKIGCVKRDFSVYLADAELKLRGIVDELLHLNDGTLAPFDYKFAEYKERLFKTHKIQSVLYAALIRKIYKKAVLRGYLCYTRSKHLIKEIIYREQDFNEAKRTVAEIIKITQKGFYPAATKDKIKCVDCCYRNICVA